MNTVPATDGSDAGSPSPEKVFDLSMFDQKDILNVVLQRSKVLYDVPSSGRIILKWSKGITEPLETIVAEKGITLAHRAIDMNAAEFIALQPTLDQIKPKRFADIGCGYGFFDLFIAHTYGAEAHLIDLEENDSRDFGFEAEGAAYSNLSKAADFLSRNGTDPDKVFTYNPAKADLSQIKDLDLIISTLACGFHFPVDSYMPFFQSSLRTGGVLIVDLRIAARRRQKAILAELGTVETLEETTKYHRVMVTK